MIKITFDQSMLKTLACALAAKFPYAQKCPPLKDIILAADIIMPDWREEMAVGKIALAKKQTCFHSIEHTLVQKITHMYMGMKYQFHPTGPQQNKAKYGEILLTQYFEALLASGEPLPKLTHGYVTTLFKNLGLTLEDFTPLARSTGYAYVARSVNNPNTIWKVGHSASLNGRGLRQQGFIIAKIFVTDSPTTIEQEVLNHFRTVFSPLPAQGREYFQSKGYHAPIEEFRNALIAHGRIAKRDTKSNAYKL